MGGKFEGLKIVAMSIIAAIFYGVLHDMVTAHLCVEYFTVFHPDLFGTTNPILLALGWGVVATWWVGLFLGLLIAGAARVGALPALGWPNLLRPLAVLLLSSYVAAALAGTAAYLWVPTPQWVPSRISGPTHLSPGAQRWFMFDWYAHNASYDVSALGALLLCAWIIRKRIKLSPG